MGDPAVAVTVGEQALVVPLSHDLPLYQTRYPDYSENLGRVAAALVAAEPGASIVDIGANVGDSVAIIRHRVADVPILCIEGDDHFLPYLRRNVRGLEEAVEVAAVYVRYSAGAGERELTVVRSRGTAQLVDRAGALHSPAVTTQSLGSILADHPNFARPALIKLDTDGHDADILLQAEAVLAACVPVVFFEFDPQMASGAGGVDPQAALELLARLGYRRALFFTNTGALADTLDADSWSSAAPALTANAGPGRPIAYFDVCAFGPGHARARRPNRARGARPSLTASRTLGPRIIGGSCGNPRRWPRWSDPR